MKRVKSHPKINLIFRLDDYSALSNTQFETTLLTLLEKHKIPCTFGVVPFAYPDEWNPAKQVEHPLTPEKVELLKPFVERRLVEVALHGYHHHTQASRLNGHIPGEFYGISMEEQRKKIQQGKFFLEQSFSCPVTTFIPPWNTYDSSTLQALEENNFSCLSMGPRFGPANRNERLAYIPALCTLSHVRSVIETLQTSEMDAAWVIVWFHEYDFIEVAPQRSQDKLSYAFLEELLSWIALQNDVITTTLREAGLPKNKFDWKRYQMANRLRQYVHLTPPFLLYTQTLPSYYPEKKWLSNQYTQWLLSFLIYYLIFFLAGTFVVSAISQLLTENLIWLTAALWASLLTGMAFFILKRRKIFYRTLSLGVGLAGGAVSGLFIAMGF